MTAAIATEKAAKPKPIAKITIIGIYGLPLTSAILSAIQRGKKLELLKRLVNCDNSASQIGPGDPAPAGRFNLGGERLLIWPGPNRFGQIDIGIGVGRGSSGHPGKCPHEVVGVDGAKGSEGRAGEFTDH